MSSADNDAPEVFSFAHFIGEARALEVNAFRAKHGDGFLLHEGPLEAGRRPKSPQHTVLIDRRVIPALNPSKPATAAPSVPAPKQGEYIVFPVRNTGRSPYPRIITVGRTKNNDVILSDVAISKFHAFFKEDNANFYVQDAGSRNGTSVDFISVPVAKRGKPALVGSGATVCFGEIELLFVNAATLRKYALERAP